MEHFGEMRKHDRDTWKHATGIGTKALRVLPLLALFPVMVGFGSCFTDRPVAGVRIAVTDFPDQPSRNYVFFSSTDAANLVVPVMHSYGDPTLYGGVIDLHNPMTGQFETYSLPPENWMALSAPDEGYSYLDVHHRKGPCEYVAVIVGERLVASCRGADVHYKLDQPQEGTLHFSLTLGTVGGTRYCAVFGGRVVHDVSTAQARVGSFLAVDAPAPSACMEPATTSTSGTPRNP